MRETPLCGDLLCECPGCQPVAIRRWVKEQDAQARAFVYYLLAAHEKLMP